MSEKGPEPPWKEGAGRPRRGDASSARGPVSRPSGPRPSTSRPSGSREPVRRPPPGPRPEERDAEDGLPDWAPWAVLFILLALGVAGALGVFSRGPAASSAAPAASSTP